MESSDLWTKLNAEHIYASVAKSLSLAILCSLKSGNEPLKLYKQAQGEIRFSSSEFSNFDAESLLSTPSCLATHIIPLLSELIQIEMSLTRGLDTEGCLLILAKYPFIFTSFSFITSEKNPPPVWASIGDTTFTSFYLVGGKTGIGNDVSGFAIFQESQPGVILDSSAFVAPSSIIAPGFSPEMMRIVAQQEGKIVPKLKKTKGSVFNLILTELASIQIPVEVRFLYGVGTTPFNNIDKVISRVNTKQMAKIPAHRP